VLFAALLFAALRFAALLFAALLAESHALTAALPSGVTSLTQ
jgi:hypothetical protein